MIGFSDNPEPDEPFEFACMDCGEFFWSSSSKYCDDMVEDGEEWVCHECYAKRVEGGAA